MKRSELHFSIELDDNNIPDKIFWLATDNNPEEKVYETKGIAVSIWDQDNKNTMKLDLWTKEMQRRNEKIYDRNPGGNGRNPKNSNKR